MRQLSAETIAQLIHDYNNGIALRELAKKYSIGLLRLKRILQAHNLGNGWRDKYPLTENVFTSTTNEAAYWIGFLMADGNVSDNGKLSLKLSAKDLSHLEKFKNFIGAKEHKIREVISDTKLPQGNIIKATSISIQLHSKKLTNDLIAAGVEPRKSNHGYFREEWCKNKYVWLGMIDGDGSVIIGSNGVPRIFLCGNTRVLEQFLAFLRVHFKWSLPSIQMADHRVPQLNLYGRKAVDVISLLWGGNNLGMTRKRVIAEKIISNIKIKKQYRGVRFDKRRNTYRAECQGKYIGTFQNAKDAADAYNQKAIEMFGDDAITNCIYD